MTTSQLIAMLVPIAGGTTAVVGGLIAKWIWVDRPRAKEARSSQTAEKPRPPALLAPPRGADDRPDITGVGFHPHGVLLALHAVAASSKLNHETDVELDAETRAAVDEIVERYRARAGSWEQAVAEMSHDFEMRQKNEDVDSRLREAETLIKRLREVERTFLKTETS